jgi:transposase-like protein
VIILKEMGKFTCPCGCNEFIVSTTRKGIINKQCKKCNNVYDDNYNILFQFTKHEQIINQQLSTPTITCPYCQSTNTQKISGLSKAGSVALWGIFALGKTTKQWHCNNCNSDF